MRAARVPAVMSLDAASDAEPSEIGEFEEIEMKGNASCEAAQQQADAANCVGDVSERVGKVSGVALDASTGGTDCQLVHSAPFGHNDTEIDAEDAFDSGGAHLLEHRLQVVNVSACERVFFPSAAGPTAVSRPSS